MKRQDKYVNKSEINEELRRINGTKDFITPSGKVYKDIGNDILFRRSIFPNKHNGYLYTALQKNNGEMIQRRVHILVAEAYRVTGITKSTILSQCRHKTKTHPRCGYYFRFLEEFDFDGFVL